MSGYHPYDIHGKNIFYNTAVHVVEFFSFMPDSFDFLNEIPHDVGWLFAESSTPKIRLKDERCWERKDIKKEHLNFFYFSHEVMKTIEGCLLPHFEKIRSHIGSELQTSELYLPGPALEIPGTVYTLAFLPQKTGNGHLVDDIVISKDTRWGLEHRCHIATIGYKPNGHKG